MKGAQARANLNKLGLAGLPELIENISGTMLALQGHMDKTQNSFEKFSKRLSKDNKKLIETFSKQNDAVEEGAKRINKFGHEVNFAGVAITRTNKRTAILSKTLKELGNFKKPKSFDLFSIRSLKRYRKEGGTVAEYLAEFLTNSREEIRILGVEAAKIRRFVFGFIPGGFTFLSKFGFALQAIGGIQRTLFADAKKGIKDTTKESSKLTKGLKGIKGFLTFTKNDFGKLKKLIGKTRIGKYTGIGSKMVDVAGRGQRRKGADGKFTATKTKFQKKFGVDFSGAGFKQYFGIGTKLIDTPKGKRRKGAGGKFTSVITPFQKNRKELFDKLKNIKFAAKFKGMFNKIKLMSRAVGMFFLYFLAFASGLYIILKLFGPTIEKAFNATKQVVLFGLSLILPAIQTIWTGLKGIWNVFFGDGTLTDFINSIITLSWGLLQLAVGLVITLGGAVVTFVAGVAFGLFATIIEKISDLSTKGKIALAAGALIGVAAFILGAKVWLAALLAFLVYKFYKEVIKGKIKDTIEELKDAVFRVKLFKKAKEKLVSAKDKISGFISSGISGNMRKRATGGIVGFGETTLVGERGAELVKLPAGSKVFTNKQTRNMTGSTVNNFNITINARDSSKEEMRRMADEIGRIVSTKINRRSSFRNSI